MNLSKYPTLHRDVPSEKPSGPADATDQQRLAVAFYGDEWITPERLKRNTKPRSGPVPNDDPTSPATHLVCAHLAIESAIKEAGYIRDPMLRGVVDNIQQRLGYALADVEAVQRATPANVLSDYLRRHGASSALLALAQAADDRAREIEAIQTRNGADANSIFAYQTNAAMLRHLAKRVYPEHPARASIAPPDRPQTQEDAM